MNCILVSPLPHINTIAHNQLLLSATFCIGLEYCTFIFILLRLIIILCYILHVSDRSTLHIVYVEPDQCYFALFYILRIIYRLLHCTILHFICYTSAVTFIRQTFPGCEIQYSLVLDPGVGQPRGPLFFIVIQLLIHLTDLLI